MLSNSHLKRVSFVFGFLSMLAGIIGVTIGTVLSQKLVRKYPKADPFICGCGLLLSAPLLAASMLLVTEDERCCYGLIFASMLTLNLNWSIVADILLVRLYFPIQITFVPSVFSVSLNNIPHI